MPHTQFAVDSNFLMDLAKPSAAEPQPNRRDDDSITGSGGLQTAGRGAKRLAIKSELGAQGQNGMRKTKTGRDCVASGGLETAPPCAASPRPRQLLVFLARFSDIVPRDVALDALEGIRRRVRGVEGKIPNPKIPNPK